MIKISIILAKLWQNSYYCQLHCIISAKVSFILNFLENILSILGKFRKHHRHRNENLRISIIIEI